MEIKKISRGQMPPANKYVLIFVPSRPWSDSDDEYGKWWTVAKCEYGISKIEREKLSNSSSYSERERARIIRSCDEDGNNLKPYCFKEFGHGSYFGQEVDIWCELPIVDEKEYEGYFFEEDDEPSEDFEDNDEDVYDNALFIQSKTDEENISPESEALFKVFAAVLAKWGIDLVKRALEKAEDDKECKE